MPDELKKLIEVERLLGKKSFATELEYYIRDAFNGADLELIKKQFKKNIETAKKTTT